MSNPRDFFDLVKAIGESKSKQEEDRIITEEVAYLKKIIPQTGNTKKKLKELIVRSLYVEMLGLDASFAYIKAVELCASSNIHQKKVGYLAAALCLSPDHEFRFMLVNQIQRDMNSSNVLEICAALSAVCKIVTEDMIPAVIGDVVKLLKHDMEAVRKWSIGAMHRLYQMDKQCLRDHTEKVRRVLCDRDPAVMGACLPLLHDMVKDDVASFKDLVPSLVSILKQIVEHRLPREFDYHRIPAPWIQMHILRILALLGRGDQASSEGMYEVLVDVMRRADTGINVGYAIVFQAVHTVTTIYPNTLLLDAAATSISRFIRSDSHNLKYIGIKGLAAIVRDHPRYAVDHQLAVIDCLEDPDETLKRKTLDLLFRMTNAVNVEFIVEKLLSFLGSATDDHFRTDLVGQITQCAERFAPSNAWYVQTMVKVFELAGDKVKMSVAQTLMQLIAEGAEEGDEDEEEEGQNKDEQLRTQAVDDFLSLMDKPKLPDILSQAVAWVLGEYGYLSTESSKETIIDKLCGLAAQTKDDGTRAHVITAIMKLVAQSGSCPSRVTELIQLYSHSKSLDVQQRCLEFKALLQNSSTMADVLPVDASCEDIEVDEDLSFLDAFVQRALAAGCPPYSPPAHLADDDDDGAKEAVLKITPYEKPTLPPAPSLGFMATGAGASAPASATPATSSAAPVITPSLPTSSNTQGNQLLNSGLKGVSGPWGRKPEPVFDPTPAPAPATVDTPSAPTPAAQSYTSAALNASVQVSAASPAPAVPEGPRVLTEKEKMAAALFGGVASGASKAAPATKRKSVIGAPAPAAATVGAPATANVLDMDFAASPAPAPAPVPSYPPAPPVSNDLFDLLDVSAPVQPVQQVYQPSPPMPAAPIDIFGSLSMMPTSSPVHAPVPAPAPAPPAAPVNLISDVFSSMNMNTTLSPAPLAPAPDVRPLNITTAQFGQRWGGIPNEQKRSVGTRLRALDQVRQAMPPSYAHVESILQSSEAIYAASVGVSGIILVHVKLNIQRMSADLIVKGPSGDVCAQELANIAAALS